MKGVLIGLAIFFALTIAVAVVGFGTYTSNFNKAVEFETTIEAQWDENRNVLSATTTRVMEMAQVNEMYRDDLKEIVEATFQGRYGDDGSDAAWQWIQEQNPQVDSSLYTNLQATIEAGRNEFKTSQTRLIDHRRQYQTALRKNIPIVGTGWWMRMAGFPSEDFDFDKYDILVEGSVQDRFDNGEDQVLDIRS